MAFWRRIWQRGQDGSLAACTALDVGTEFAKALVFEIDDHGHGTVKGVGRQRQGLSHMQSGTVADIAAVVDNCSVALQEAEEMAGFRPSQVVIGIAGELVKGFTTIHVQERKKPTLPIAEQELQKLIAIVAEPYAVARVLGSDQVLQAGALFVDVGGGTTDVALVRGGGIEGTRMFALGGRAFTKSLADRLDLPFPRAEAIKVDYARGLAGDQRAEVGAIIGDDVTVWAAGVELVTEELSGGDQLPSKIYLCGGGSRLPEIPKAL